MRDPQISFDKGFPNEYIVDELGFFEFQLLGHVFGIPTSREYSLFLSQYIRNSFRAKQQYFKEVRKIKLFTDMDITFKFLKT